MAGSRNSAWIFGFALIFTVLGCSPESADRHQRATPEIKLPSEFASSDRYAGAKQSQANVASPATLPQATAERTVFAQVAPVSGETIAEAMATDGVTLPDFRRPSVGTFSRQNDSAATDPNGFFSVDVLYATDREQNSLSLDAYQLTGQRELIGMLGMGVVAASMLCLIAWLCRRPATAKLSGVLAGVLASTAAAVFFTGSATIEKHGVTYTGGRGGLVRGVCHVTVPKTHARGSVERPTLLKFEVAENQAKHIVLTSVTELPHTAFEKRLSEQLAAADQPDVLVFIHGFNVDFESAVLRTAQIAVDLPFHGVPICYSWPSQGTLLGYPVDESNAAWTVGHLKEFLVDLVDHSGAKSIHVVAHSMGNRAMTAAMQQIAYQRPNTAPIFDRVVLAAPDVDADLFRKELANTLTDVAKQVTLYASSDDQALMASKTVHGYPRAGESGAKLVIVPGIETIDVSGIDLSLLGHSYYGDSEPILKDLHDVLLSKLPAPQRSSLVTFGQAPQIWWQLANEARIATSSRR